MSGSFPSPGTVVILAETCVAASSWAFEVLLVVLEVGLLEDEFLEDGLVEDGLLEDELLEEGVA